MAKMTVGEVTVDMAGDRAPGVPLIDCADGVGLDVWARTHRAWIDRTLLQHGGLLFRGGGVDTAERLALVAGVVCEQLVDYVYQSTPRTAIGAHVYTATEYRADAAIPMHNENAYQHRWPLRLLFCCVRPAETGGATPLARTLAVTNRIADDVKQRFVARGGVMYTRNYHRGVDVSWQTTFQTESKADVEAFCQREAIQCEWLAGGRLRTRQVSQAMTRHPATGDTLWFNQAHLFHVSSLSPDQRALMLDLFAEDELPRQAYYGDGTAIEADVLEHIRAAYAEETFVFPWQQGDLLLLDNMLICHGRQPYTGARRVLAAMGDPVGPG